MNGRDSENDVESDRAAEEELSRQFEPWRVVVCGSRSWGGQWPDREVRSVREHLEIKALLWNLDGLLDAAQVDLAGEVGPDGVTNMVLVHGACPTGADALAARWAESHPEVAVETFPADWKRYGRRAGPIRNRQMVETLDPSVVGHHLVLAAWDGQSRGTWSTIRFAKEAGIPVLMVGCDPRPPS